MFTSSTAKMLLDLWHALRLLRRRPGASALVVGTLAIGIAATTIVFSLADAIIWHPLPFRDADRLVRIRSNVGVSESLVRLDPGRSLFDGPHPFGLDSAMVTVGGEARAVTVALVSPGVLHALGVTPIWGREFASDEFVAGRPVVIVSADLWRRQQSVAASPDDHRIIVDGARHAIVGVMPEWFEFPVSRVALWRPYVPDPASRHSSVAKRPGHIRRRHGLSCLCRSRGDVFSGAARRACRAGRSIASPVRAVCFLAVLRCSRCPSPSSTPAATDRSST